MRSTIIGLLLLSSLNHAASGVTRVISADMNEDEERDHIRASLETIVC